MVRGLDGREDRVDVVQQPCPATLCKVEVRPGIEHDLAPVGVRRPADRWLRHAACAALGAAGSAGAKARVKRSASSLAERACR